MPGKKGKTNNPNGRPKGTQNKTTKIARDLLLSNRESIIQKALDLALDEENPNTQLLSKLLDKLIPTLSSTDQNNYNLNADLERDLTKEEREELKNKLLKKLADG